jgi:hypothetical protein
MKAQVTNTGIYTHRILPDTFNGKNGLMLNFRNASKEVLESEGFYDVVKPSFDPQIQTKGGLYFDQDKKIVTYDVTDIDFNQEVDIVDEDGKPTGETEKRYKIADIKASKLSEIKSKAGKMLEPTDWQIIRKAERDIAINSDVATKRAEILAEADRLEAEVNAKKSYKTALQYNVKFFPPSEKE